MQPCRDWPMQYGGAIQEAGMHVTQLQCSRIDAPSIVSIW